MKVPHNYLPEQYADDRKLDINHNYLLSQFQDCSAILRDIEKLVKTGDYTLGLAVDAFEERIRTLTGSRFAIGLGSGTDAIMLSLKASGVGEGDEVITTPYTFFATVGAIVTSGAKPVFVDIADDYNLDPSGIDDAVTESTKAILPVHWGGQPCEMEPIMEIAGRLNLAVIEDACHALLAEYKGKQAGRFGLAGCFSMHPLKNLNVWGDGGFVITDSPEIHERLMLTRNHGLINRNECAVFAYNSRLDSIQALVANHLLERIEAITRSRISNANLLDERLQGVQGITLPPRRAGTKAVYHLYVIRAEQRDDLQLFLRTKGVDAKVHYPIPMHLQPAARGFGYGRGDFPRCEAICDSVLSLPVHEFITEVQIDRMVESITEFYDAC